MAQMFASVRSRPAQPASLETDAESDGATELPGDIAAARHAHHVAADLLLEYGPPRHQVEAEPVVDHREAAAGELHRTEKLATDRLTLVDGLEGEAAFAGELPADAFDFLSRQR